MTISLVFALSIVGILLGMGLKLGSREETN
jgi:hypothetical protein